MTIKSLRQHCLIIDLTYRIADFDGDDMISAEDLKEVINRLTGDQELSEEDMARLIENVRTATITSRENIELNIQYR